MAKINFISFVFLIRLLENFKLNVSHIFLVDRLKLVFLLAAFFVRVIHVGVNSSILCVLYSSLFFHSVLGGHLNLFHFFPQLYTVLFKQASVLQGTDRLLGFATVHLARYIKLFTKVVVSFSLLPAAQGNYILMFHIRGQQTFSVKSHIIDMLAFSTKWQNRATILHGSLIAF